MIWTNITNTLLVVSAVCYFGHSYWHNTMDLSHYRHRKQFPAANPVLKYLYLSSFFLFAACCALLLASVVLDAAQSRSRTAGLAFLAASVLLAIGAACVVPRPQLEHWRRRDAR